MRIRLLIAALAFLGATAAPGLAAAYTTAYAASGVTNLRAGPGTEYPVIARVLGGSRVNVVGCLSSRSWCDVIVQDIRGWMSTTRLEFLYGGQLVYVPRYYSYFDVPVIGFDFGYWDRHYRDRSWYRDRWRWREHDDRPVYIDPDQGPPEVAPGPEVVEIDPEPGPYIDPDTGPGPEFILPEQSGGIGPDGSVLEVCAADDPNCY